MEPGPRLCYTQFTSRTTACLGSGDMNSGATHGDSAWGRVDSICDRFESDRRDGLDTPLSEYSRCSSATPPYTTPRLRCEISYLTDRVSITGLQNPVIFSFRPRRCANRRSIRRLRCSSRCLILRFTRNPPCSGWKEDRLHLFNP